MKAFLRYYVELPYPAAQVDEALNRIPRAWMDRAAREANRRSVLMLGVSSGEDGRASAAEKVTVTICPSAPADHAICRSISWAAAGGQDQPILRGDLELADLGPARSQLAMTAQYQPVTHHRCAEERTEAQRIGESTLKAFIDRVAGDITAVLNGATATPQARNRQPSGGAPHIRTAFGA